MTTAVTNLEKRIDGLENFKTIVAKFIKKLGDPSKWEFRGEVIDLGEYGKGTCTCDHPVRYMLLIWSPNGDVAPVGCECIKHFQAYNEILFNKLENARVGLYEALAKEDRELAEVKKQAKQSELHPQYEFAKLRFLAVCRMHKDRIGIYLPRAMWELQHDLQKPIKDYKNLTHLLKHYEKQILAVETTLGKYEQGELR